MENYLIYQEFIGTLMELVNNNNDKYNKLVTLINDLDLSNLEKKELLNHADCWENVAYFLITKLKEATVKIKELKEVQVLNKHWIKIKDNLINLDQVCYITHKGVDLDIHYHSNHLSIRFDTEKELQKVFCDIYYGFSLYRWLNNN